MAGKTKRGIDYAGWDVHIFEDDSRIDELIDAQGWVGFSIFFYLCQKAYATDGYFYRWSYSNSATTARRMGGGVGSDTVKQTVALCLRIGLFDNRLFEGEGVLTNKDIQERYMLAIERRSESARTVDPKIWLLNRQETKAFIVMPEIEDSLPENSDSLPENATKESKVNKSKVNESKLCSPSASPPERVFAEEFDSLWEIYPRKQGKDKALKAYIKARKDGSSFNEIQQGIEKYRDYVTTSAIPQQYIKHGSTWFNGKCWQDSFDVAQTSKTTADSSPNKPSYDLDAWQRWAESINFDELGFD